MRLNRRASGEELALFMFLTIMLIFAVGVYWGVRSFFNQGYDFRSVEASQLLEHVHACVEREGSAFFAANFSFVARCGFNEDVINDGKHFILLESTRTTDRVFRFGYSDYENQCGFKGGLTNAAYPRCVSGNIVIGDERFLYVVASNQNARKVLSS